MRFIQIGDTVRLRWSVCIDRQWTDAGRIGIVTYVAGEWCGVRVFGGKNLNDLPCGHLVLLDERTLV